MAAPNPHFVSALLASQPNQMPVFWPFFQSPLLDGLWLNPFLSPPPLQQSCLASPKSPPKVPKTSPRPTTDSETSQSIEAVATSLGRTEQGYKCIYCQKVYSRKYGLKIHLRTHTGFKPLKCKICSRAFSDPSNLNKHTRLHAEQTAVRCQVCGKGAARGRDLERHMLARHPELAEDFKKKPFLPRRLSLDLNDEKDPLDQNFMKRHSVDSGLVALPAKVPAIRPLPPIPVEPEIAAVDLSVSNKTEIQNISVCKPSEDSSDSDCESEAEIDVVSV